MIYGSPDDEAGERVSYEFRCPKIGQVSEAVLIEDRLLATLLAAIGLYGVLAYTVTRRTREIGIRMALGALRSHVSWLVLREVLLLVAAGIAIALPVAWWLGRYVQSQLHGVVPMDPTTLMLSLGGLSLVALLAGLIPTMRALRINPVRALRQG